MPLLDDIASRLQTQGIGTVGTTIFKGSMPDTPDAAVALIEYGGLEPEHTLGSDHVIRVPHVQVVCRGTAHDYATPRATAESVFDAMHFTAVTISGTVYMRSEAIQEPFPLKRDENDRWHIVCNYQIWVRD